VRWLLYLYDPNAGFNNWVKIGELVSSPNDTIRIGGAVGILKARQDPKLAAVGFFHPETNAFQRYYLAGGTNLIQF
jgi:hypothetical protein